MNPTDPASFSVAVTLGPSDTIRLAPCPRAPIEEDDVLERIDEWLLAVASLRRRGAQELVEWGDVVVLDVLGVTAEGLLPDGVRKGWEVQVRPDDALPGFFEALVGRRPGSTVSVELTLPGDDDQPLHVTFEMTVKEATALRWPSLDDPSVLAKLGKGSFDDLVDAAVLELTEERQLDADLATEAAVVEALLERSDVQVDDELVELEMMTAWERTEGAALIALGLDAERRSAALTRFMHDPLEREACWQRLAQGALLDAVARERGLTPTLESYGVEFDPSQLEVHGLTALGSRQAALDVLVDTCVVAAV